MMLYWLRGEFGYRNNIDDCTNPYQSHHWDYMYYDISMVTN